MSGQHPASDDVLAPPLSPGEQPSVIPILSYAPEQLAELGSAGMLASLQPRFTGVEVLRFTSTAVLYRGVPVTGGDPVVIKQYAAGIQRDDQAMSALRDVSEEHVLRIHDYRDDGGEPFYEVVEYLPGGSVRDWLNGAPGRRLATSDVMDIVRELATALAAIHQKGVAHGDVKPDNILVRSRTPLDLVLADFGLATVHLVHDRPAAVGTLPYLSPQAIQGSPEQSGDWWSLGVIVLEACTGTIPWAGLPTSEMKDAIAYQNADVSAVEDPRLRLLCRGLLTRTSPREERWGWDQVSRWLVGGTPALGRDWTVQAEAAPTMPAYEFDGLDYDDVDPLAAAMIERDRWDRAIEIVSGQYRFDSLARWLTHRAALVGDTHLPATLDAIATSRDPAGARLVRLVAAIQHSLLVPALKQLAVRGRQHPDSDSARSVAALAATGALTHLGPEGAQIERQWSRTRGRWSSLQEEQEPAPPLVVGQAQSWLLLATLDDRALAELAVAARDAATSQAQEQDWYRRIVTSIADPGNQMALITLADLATRRAAEARLDRERKTRVAAAVLLHKTARTRRMLGWTLLVLVPLAVADVLVWWQTRSAAAHPEFESSDGVYDAYQAVESLPPTLLSWLVAVADPLVTVPLAVAGCILLWRSRLLPRATVGSRLPRHVRHPLERRAMQAVILVTALLIPPLLVVVLVSSWPRPPGTGGGPGRPAARTARAWRARWHAVPGVAIGALALCYPGAYFGLFGAFVRLGTFEDVPMPPGSTARVVMPLAVGAVVVILTALADVLWLGALMRWYVALALQAVVWGLAGWLYAPYPADANDSVTAAIAAAAVAAAGWLLLRRLILFRRDRGAQPPPGTPAPDANVLVAEANAAMSPPATGAPT